jgi:uncharacterized protein
MTSVLVVPRWSGTATSDWYPWLALQLAAPAGPTVDVVPLQPDPDAPLIGPAVAELALRVRDAADPVVLVGHSVGCQVVLRYLGREPDPKVEAAVMVAGWFTVDESWPAIQSWLEASHEVDSLPIPTWVLVSTNDPFTADAAATRDRWMALGAAVSLHDDVGHFNASEEPAVLEVVRRSLRRWR